MLTNSADDAVPPDHPFHVLNDVMPRQFARKVLNIGIALAFAAGGVAHGAAVVGETQRVPPQPAPVVRSELFKMDYRRPDTIPFPSRDPYTPAKAILGRMLFFDTRLSGSGTLACVSCHNPAFAHGDGHAKSIGEGMRTLDRRAPAVINGAWGQLFMWDGRAASLEEQALMPIKSPTEMNEPLDRMIQVVSQVGEYKTMIATVFPRRGLTPGTVADAIATYERTIVSATAPFDAWIDGDASAIPEAPAAASFCSTPRRDARHAMAAGCSPMTGFMTSDYRTAMSAAAVCFLGSSRWDTRSRRPVCGRSGSGRRICTMAHCRHWKPSSPITIKAASTASASPN